MKNWQIEPPRFEDNYWYWSYSNEKYRCAENFEDVEVWRGWSDTFRDKEELPSEVLEIAKE